jgi:hypothetical protein
MPVKRVWDEPRSNKDIGLRLFDSSLRSLSIWDDSLLSGELVHISVTDERRGRRGQGQTIGVSKSLLAPAEFESLIVVCVCLPPAHNGSSMPLRVNLKKQNCYIAHFFS